MTSAHSCLVAGQPWPRGGTTLPGSGRGKVDLPAGGLSSFAPGCVTTGLGIRFPSAALGVSSRRPRRVELHPPPWEPLAQARTRARREGTRDALRPLLRPAERDLCLQLGQGRGEEVPGGPALQDALSPPGCGTCVPLACAVVPRCFCTGGLWWWVTLSGRGAQGRCCHLPGASKWGRWLWGNDTSDSASRCSLTWSVPATGPALFFQLTSEPATREGRRGLCFGDAALSRSVCPGTAQDAGVPAPSPLLPASVPRSRQRAGNGPEDQEAGACALGPDPGGSGLLKEGGTEARSLLAVSCPCVSGWGPASRPEGTHPRTQ